MNVLQGLPDNPPSLPQLFPVPGGMDQFMRPLSGLLMHCLQNAAMAGNGNYSTAFWMQCMQTNFQFPGFKDALQHAASLAYAYWMQNNQVVNNLPGWLGPVAEEVALSYPLMWASQHAQQFFQNADQQTMMTVRNSIAQYTQKMQNAMQAFQSGINNSMMNGGGFNMGMPGMGNMGMGNGNQGWNMGGGNPGFTQQQLAMMMGQSGQNGQNMWGQPGNGMGMNQGWFNSGQGNGFNPNAFGQQMQNNAFNNQGSNWTYNNGQQQTNILSAGKVGGFESADQGNGRNMSTQQQLTDLWTGGGTQNQNNQQQPPPPPAEATYGWGANTHQDSFKSVGNGNQSSMDAMLSMPSHEINAAAASANLTHFGTPQTAPVEQPYQTDRVATTAPTPNRAKVVNPKNLPVRIVMVNNIVQRHLKFVDSETEISLCDVENGVIINQEIRKIETDMEFKDQNTARFLAPKGTKVGHGAEDDGLTLAQTASRAMNSVYLEDAIATIKQETTAEVLDSEEITKALARISEEKIIRLENVIEGSFNTPTTRIENYFVNRGVDAVFNKSVIVADMIQLDTTTLTPELATVIDELRDKEDTVSGLVYGFNRLRPLLAEQNWSRLNREITIWLNEELYTRWGLSLAMDDFSSQFEELAAVLQNDRNGISWDDVQMLIRDIKDKFLNVYRHDSPNAETIYTQENGYPEDAEYNLLGIMHRYATLPIYSKDLTISTNGTSGIVNHTNQAELYNILATAFPNLSKKTDVVARNFVITLNGDIILVTSPKGMSQYVLTRMENGMIRNPLIK